MFVVEMKTDGAAFKDPCTGGDDDLAEAIEIARLLNGIRCELRNGAKSGVVMDTNGNRVGKWRR